MKKRCFCVGNEPASLQGLKDGPSNKIGSLNRHQFCSCLWGYYTIQLVGLNLKGGRGPKLDECMTYHKWRIRKLGSRDDVISQPAIFDYFTILTDEIGQLNNIQLYNLKDPISDYVDTPSWPLQIG